MTSIQPIVSTPDLPRLRAFYEKVLGATQTLRVPDEGPEFFVELRVGDTAFGIARNENTEIGAPVRVILSAEVDDVDALLPVVEAAGGRAPSQPNDMPWGQRVAHVHDPDGNMLNLTRWLTPGRGPVHEGVAPAGVRHVARGALGEVTAHVADGPPSIMPLDDPYAVPRRPGGNRVYGYRRRSPYAMLARWVRQTRR